MSKSPACEAVGHMSNAARDLGDLLVGDLNVGRFMSFSPIAGINDPH